jgi:glycosyltransferase involved in cell wall biosynthesis
LRFDGVNKYMKIGIDARSILNPEKNPAIGLGHYVYQLIRHLLEIDPDNQYVLFFDYRLREKDVKKFSQPNVKIKYFPFSDYKKYLPGAYSEILGLATLSGEKIDVLHIMSPDTRVPLGHRGKVVCTFQDLAVYKYPGLFPALKKSKAKYNRQAMAKRADKIIAVSKNTKNDLKKLFRINDKKIDVVYNGIDKRFFENFEIDNEDLRRKLRKKFGITEKYVLFIGTLEPIKNITRLMEAFKLFKKENGREKYQLVLGGKRGWLARHYQQIAKDLGIGNDVKFLGYVAGDDLRKVFEGAEFFIMPSLYEGFGMTVLESMACRKPCLISNIETLKEIAGNGAEYVDPLDIKKMAKKMNEMIVDENKRALLIKNGMLRAREFSWDKCAKETLEVYQGLGK